MDIDKRYTINHLTGYQLISILLVSLLLISGVIFSGTQLVRAEVIIGGELKTSLVSTLYEGKTTWDLQEQLDLKLLLPRMGKTDAAVEMTVYNTPAGGIQTSFKKLYLRHRFEDFNLTVGKQPVSWSFGSLINPVDYTLGAEAMDQETGGKYQDAVEVYLPINWNTGLALVTSQVSNSEELKWGVRGRTEFQGYDLTANFVREPGAIQRAGITTKGDLGPFGIYGAVGYYSPEGSDEAGYSYLVGGDYNYTFGYDRQLLFQLEYLNLDRDILQNIIGSLAAINILEGDEFNLLLGNINYPIDDFSSIGLMTLSSLDDGSFLLVPTYQNQLGSNLNLTMRGTIFTDQEGGLFSIPEIPGMDTMKGAIEFSLGYSF
jgi:hypothetical protein